MTIGELTLDAHWWWMIIAVVLGVLELILPGVFLIWLSAAAAITGLVALFFGPPVALQFIIFAALALVTTYAGRRWYLTHPVESTDPMLNERSAQLIGQIVTVAAPISGGEGRVRVGDGEWPAQGPDAPVGARMRVTAIERGSLVVETA